MTFLNYKALFPILLHSLGIGLGHITPTSYTWASIEHRAESHPTTSTENIAKYPPAPIDSRADEALAYCKVRKINTSYCVLVDMSIPSGKNRLFVYDFKKKKTIIKGLCAHGIGGGSTAFKVVFSNKVKSNCSSLGKYKLGKRAYSNWGIHAHYKMHGLDSTNSNAYKRLIVLHSYSPVPEHEIHPNGLFNISQGCPVIADLTMVEIDNLIKGGEKDMLLWIYN